MEKLQLKDDEILEEQHKSRELEKKLKDLKKEIQEQTKSTLLTDDLKLEFEGHIEKKDEFITQLSDEILKLREDMKGKS